LLSPDHTLANTNPGTGKPNINIMDTQQGVKPLLPCSAQPGDPVIFRLNNVQSFSAHVFAVKFCDQGEILYDLDIYPVKDRWQEHRLRINDIHFAFVEAIPLG
jgi:hypothetical protein